jgi:hypothetical protein
MSCVNGGPKLSDIVALMCPQQGSYHKALTVQMCAAMLFFCVDMARSFQQLHDRANNNAAPGSPAWQALVGSLHAAFAVWTMFSLRTTLLHCQSKGGVRLQIYRIFASCLAVVGMACVAYLFFEGYIHATHPVYDKWQYEWVRIHKCSASGPHLANNTNQYYCCRCT